MIRATTVATVVLAFVALASPAAASPATQTSTYWGAKASCKYTSTNATPDGAWTEALLHKIVVKPPEIYARNGRRQTVGWGLVVRRYDDGFEGYSEEILRSRLQTATATPARPADFSTKRVVVEVPSVEDQSRVYYSIHLRVQWFRADGSEGLLVGEWFYDFSTYVDGTFVGDWNADQPVNYCGGLIREATD